MFAVGRGFAVPKVGGKVSKGGWRDRKESSLAGYMPAHHDSMPAQKHESSSP